MWLKEIERQSVRIQFMFFPFWLWLCNDVLTRCQLIGWRRGYGSRPVLPVKNAPTLLDLAQVTAHRHPEYG